ncbi:unnamed protein product [Clavelina lepadiformis]|uniref:TLC domain-containing protein n=1 Tax=Clavelina lepadiformis TaxID=159417 RepID=A0ABP0F6E9_CLALP
MYLTDSSTGLLLTLGFAILFKLCSFVIRSLCPIPENVVLHKKFERWFNITVSLTHSCLASMGCLFCFYLDSSLASKMRDGHSFTAVVVTYVSLGYFVHDLVHAIFYRKLSSAWEIIIHHIVVIVSFGVAVILDVYVNFVIVSLLCEISSIFLHIRQLFNLGGIPPTSFVYRMNSLVNIVMYVLFRICTLAWMVRWLVLHRGVVPPMLHSIGTVGMAVMTVINIVLFARLLRKDYGNLIKSAKINTFTKNPEITKKC